MRLRPIRSAGGGRAYDPARRSPVNRIPALHISFDAMKHFPGASAWSATARCAAVGALAGCAHQGTTEQLIEVQVVAESPGWSGALACEASNAAGKWPFTAPGKVAVLPSTDPLRITCTPPAGSLAEPSLTSPAAASPNERRREGASAGAKVGAGTGVALGVAAAPVMGGAFAVLIAAGAAMKGAEIGGLVGTMRSGEKNRYPSPVVLRVKREPTNSVDGP